MHGVIPVIEVCEIAQIQRGLALMAYQTRHQFIHVPHWGTPYPAKIVIDVVAGFGMCAVQGFQIGNAHFGQFAQRVLHLVARAGQQDRGGFDMSYDRVLELIP